MNFTVSDICFFDFWAGIVRQGSGGWRLRYLNVVPCLVNRGPSPICPGSQSDGTRNVASRFT